MKYDEMTCFRCAVAVAVTCMEDERPQSETVTPQQAAEYICNVLGYRFRLLRDRMHSCSDDLSDLQQDPADYSAQRAGYAPVWFHAHAAQERVAQELEGTLHDLIEEVVAVSA